MSLRSEKCCNSLNGNEKIRRFQADCAVSNDDPHPQVRDAFGLTMGKPTPVKPSRKSKVAPRKNGTDPIATSDVRQPGGGRLSGGAGRCGSEGTHREQHRRRCP